MAPARFEEEYAIRRVLERYMRYNDDGDLEGMLSLFAPDAVYRVLGREMVGHDAIAAFLGELGFLPGAGRWTDPGQENRQPRSMHLISNPVVDVDGDVAVAESDFVTLRRNADGDAELGLVGRYRDRLRKGTDGEWRFTERGGVALQRGGFGK